MLTRGPQLKAYGFIVVAALLWGSMGVMAKTLYSLGVAPWSLIFFRASLGFVACALFVALVDRRWFRARWQDMPFLLAYGLTSVALFFSLYLFTISLVTVAVAVVLLYTAPAMASVMARVAFGEALTPIKITALVLSFGGCVLVAGLIPMVAPASVLGIATGVGSAFAYALYTIMSKQGRARYNAWTLQFYAFGFGTLFLLPVLALEEFSAGPYPPEAWLLIVLVAAGPSLAARVLYVAALKHVEASRGSIVANVEPVAAALFAYLILGEILSPSQLIGGFLVLAGAALAQQRSFGLFHYRGRAARASRLETTQSTSSGLVK